MHENIEITTFSKEYLGLARSFKVNPKVCGRDSYYERYLKDETDESKQSGNIIGYITLRASSLNNSNSKNDFVDTV